MDQMRQQMLEPHQMSDFARPRIGPKTLATQIGLAGDFPGCYVLMEPVRPIYVGISRGVIARLRQQVLGKTHFDASLAYRMASLEVGHSLKRGEAMNQPEMISAFSRAKSRLVGCNVAFVEIQNDLELYLFEAYCAMELDTSDWNTFRTH